MSASPLLHDEDWLKLLAHVAEAYTDVTLSRGFTSFKQGQVVSLSMAEARMVQAKVDDSDSYRVTLDLDQLAASRCTCPVGRSCKHLAAVMMELGDRLGYPAAHIMNAKMHMKRAAAAASSESAILELPNLPVSAWQQFLDNLTIQFKPALDQGSYVLQLRNHLAALSKYDIPFSAQDRAFFELHQELFLLRKIKSSSSHSASFFTSSTIYKVYDDIMTWLKANVLRLSLEQSGDRLTSTLAYIRQQMAEQTGHSYQDFGIYTALWTAWRKADGTAAHVHARKELEAWPSASTPSLHAANTFLLLVADKPNDAWSFFEAAPSFKDTPAYLFVSFFDYMIESRRYADLIDWLKKSNEFFSNPRTRELDTYAKYWQIAIQHVPQGEGEMWQALEALLPRSFWLIEKLLYERGNWKAWLEMQISQGRDPLFHRVSVLQPIEKEQPQLLLPYYHQAVHHYVGLKNRHDYKAAVKLLKRLGKVYKKLKQPERWAAFLDGFADRHSRLRALQEELKKGKLLE
ncbi:SWIM zinc finger domain-containing protein [Paenibacillus sp. GCM10023248]|uniref:SWIM zinc finger family protein n=1 Tax=unclassified Paenibacillus TaxID=185978 RepID=UPI002379449B|nr:SWIM zinc finger family protein [Paenibacillus sp. MAHUQ-63]MDD9268885.1 SWIM zinc finger family protein [Paenibacillus sp. MAHUQ-63]